jgi:hypothetical protein
MNIQELVDLCKDIALTKLDVQSFYIGQTFDMSLGKGDKYKCFWFETPVLSSYQTIDILTKEFTFSIDILDIAKSDDVEDEVQKISECEELSDLFLYYLKQEKKYLSLVDKPTGLTMRNANADNACGIRLDIKVNTGRLCPQK